MQVDVWFEHLSAVAREVDGNDAGTDRPCDRPAKGRKQYLGGRQSQAALDFVDIRCQRTRQRRGQFRQIAGVGRSGIVLPGHPQSWP
jgi:hypothetical protein